MTWSSRLSESELVERTADVVAAGFLDGERAVFVHDLDRMARRVKMLREAFPENALHAVAVKANPLLQVLKELVASGAGLECASREEVELSLAAGCPPASVVYDSPAKTVDDLRFSIAKGLHLNLDNFDELARVAEIVKDIAPSAPIGIRVNPQVGGGKIAMTSVAGRISKFGVPLKDRHQELIEAYTAYPWLNALHVHVGSQGCAMQQLVDAVRHVFDFRAEVQSLREAPITHVDIGGGLPVIYKDSDNPPEVQAYVSALRETVPEAFEDVHLVTEFGRSIHASCGWAISRVEYVKEEQGQKMAVLHLGADAFMRPVYASKDWHHDFIALNADGGANDATAEEITLVGPLCFGGDILARDRPLPSIKTEDLVVIRDAGAYTLSIWSRHCSRGLPTVVGWRSGELRVLKKREQPEDVVRFWS